MGITLFGNRKNIMRSNNCRREIRRRFTLRTGEDLSNGRIKILHSAAVLILVLCGSHGSAIAQSNIVSKNERRSSPALTKPSKNRGVENPAQSVLLPRVTYADLVEKVVPSVVTVRSERSTPIPSESELSRSDPTLQGRNERTAPPRQTVQIERGIGSGVIVDPNGIILTNDHVIDGASLVKVDLPDKRTFTARVIGTDPPSDLAVLKIDAANLPVLILGNSDVLRAGDVVLAVGNPFGIGQTVTTGIISAKGRQTGLSNGGFEDFLQTDAAINQGNSGGALVNLNGELVGINSELLSPSGGSVGIGFAIPSNMARSVMAQLLKDGKVHRGMMGVGTQNVTSDLAEAFGLKDVRGVLVDQIKQGSPAEAGGLKVGDVILGFDGTSVNDGNEIRNKIAQTAPGTSVTLSCIRDGSPLSLRIVLGEMGIGTETQTASGSGDETMSASDKLGLLLQPLTPQIAAKIGETNTLSGLVIDDVETGSPADDAGLAPGDVILQIDRHPINTLNEAEAALNASKGHSVLLFVSRQGQTYFMTVEQ